MQQTKFKTIILLLALILPTAWCGANGTVINVIDGIGHITIKEAGVQGMPKGSSIQASINGHYLTVSFTENLGQVAISVTTDTGPLVDCTSTPTPNGIQFYIPLAGDYIVNLTLPNGDEYYGEFTVMD